MEKDQQFLSYMLAHVRLHSVSKPHFWSTQEIMESYLTLPPPLISFDQWVAIRGMTDTEVAAHNEAALEAIKNDQKIHPNVPVKIKEVKDA